MPTLNLSLYRSYALLLWRYVCVLQFVALLQRHPLLNYFRPSVLQFCVQSEWALLAKQVNSYREFDSSVLCFCQPTTHTYSRARIAKLNKVRSNQFHLSIHLYHRSKKYTLHLLFNYFISHHCMNLHRHVVSCNLIGCRKHSTARLYLVVDGSVILTDRFSFSFQKLKPDIW